MNYYSDRIQLPVENGFKAELDWLTNLYLEHLSEEICYGSGTIKPRVRHPSKWKRLTTTVDLMEGKTTQDLSKFDNVWVWSDQHFFHKNIIEFSERPFVDVDTMNAHMIANFNDYVGENDASIWVGDVGFKSTTMINELLDKCNGYKILVIGNHDFNGKNVRKLNFDETHLLYYHDHKESPLVFTHYPMDNIIWPWINVHGHLHIFPKPDTGNMLHVNVNCELYEYKPVHLDELIRIAKSRITSHEHK